MNLRKEIEKLIYWYIPAIMITYFLGTAVTAQVKQINGATPLLTWGILAISLLLNHVHSIVVAIWLYFLAKKMNQRNILWALFGLVAHIFAVALFIALYVYEETNPNEDNNIKVKRKLFIWSK
ncbi:hypothetical protein [Sulfurimonas sp.]|uniref:hypothetical protein n=1 Tax=Sulfurimonas sp. TaxID=2022749 RepID=UPI002B469FC3|nr:hypothetical protein [Sulfurimonas sp.]